jgi:hypothetical protein
MGSAERSLNEMRQTLQWGMAAKRVGVGENVSACRRVDENYGVAAEVKTSILL